MQNYSGEGKTAKQEDGMNKFRGLILVLLVTAVLASAALAQNIVTGGISGIVSDPTGAVISGAKITLTSRSTGEKQTGTTSASGSYNFPLLKPGPYIVLVEQSGFRSVSTAVDVQLAQISPVNVRLEVGSAGQTVVEVSGQAPLLQTEDANISTTYGAAEIDNLPNPGGDITTYAQTAPGVVMNSGVGFGYGNFSAFGLPGTSNLFTLNGNDENDPFLNLNNSGSSNLLLGQNELQEVAVVSNGYTGQYGRQAGVQIDYTTKSGSNALHGDLSYWYNSSGFNANDWFFKNSELANGKPNKPVFAVANQWAGSVGGPIKKDKLFFYVDTEGLHYALPGSQTVYFPTPAFSAAILSNISANQPAQLPYYTTLMNLYKNAPSYGSAGPLNSGVDPKLGCGDLAITGFGAGAAPCLNTLTAAGVNHNKEWLLTTRIDYNISNYDRLFGRFKLDHGQQPTSTDLVDPKVFSTQSVQPEYEGQINETHIFSPSVTNNLIISGLWYSAVFLPDSGQSAVLSALGMSTINFGPNLMSALGGTSPNAPDYIFPQGRNSTMGQVTDDLSITRGSHTFKMGINFRRDDLSDYDAQIGTGGFASFTSMTDFYNGLVDATKSDFYFQGFTQNAEVPIAFYSMGLYFQDEYRVSPNLKFTIALRGDRNSNAVCQTNCFSRLNTPFSLMSHDASIPYNAVISTGLHSAFPNIEKVALQPRLGFTWSPGGHSSTVLRGGIGIFSDLYQGVLLDNMISNSPRTNSFTVLPVLFGGSAAPLAPTVSGSAPAIASASNTAFLNGFGNGGTFASISASMPPGALFSAPGYFSIANQILNPKYMEWNFEIQQAIGPKTSVSVNYVGTHGYDALVQNPGLNAVNSGKFPFGQVPTPCPAGSPTSCVVNPPDQRFGTIDELASVGRSNYDGVVAGITRRATYGLQFSANYTFSHSLDDLTSTNPGTPYNVISSLVRQINPYNLDANNYSNSDSDARHNFTASYVWNPPYKLGNRMLNEVVGGWGIAETFFYHSAFPFSVITSEGQIGNYNGSFLADYLGGGMGNCSTPGSDYPAAPNQCLKTSQFAAPGDGGQPGFGNVRRNAFRGPKYFNTDFTITKSFAITERARLQLGANMYNILNHPNFFSPFNNVAGGGFGTLFPSASVPPTTPYGSYQGAGVSGRLVQLQGKFIF